jgi:uncharacterized protein
MQQLYQAARAGDRAQVQTLIEADPTLAVFAAAILGDDAAMEALLAADPSLVTAVSADGWTPLHLAAHFGRTPVVRLLLNKGAQANMLSTNVLRNSALHAAAAGRAAEAGRLLIDHGADVDAQQNGGWTPLHAASQNGDIEFAGLLLEAGASVNSRADNHQRPLDLALTKGQQAMVDFLESHGAAL